ncbi:MAG: hypothetical protein JTT11_06680 [Candidatus Brockarchaeota archaeon]|nr:hypothetical protein [Candidatus Brockarchaeota archaeon]
MLKRRVGLLRDRKGISGTAAGALLSIAVLLLYLQFISTLQGAEAAFWAVFGFLKWLAGAMGHPHLFDEFEAPIEELQGTPFWPMAVYTLSLAFMSSILYGTFWGTREIVNATTKILAWGRSRREERHVFRDRGEKKSRSWRKSIPVNLPRARVFKKRRGKVSGEVDATRVQRKELEAWKEPLKGQWWHLRYGQAITLQEGKLGELIEKARALFPTERSPDGSYIELANALGMSASALRNTVGKGRDSMTVKNLMKLLDLLEIPYDALTPYIKSVGSTSHKEAIINPKFPIDMECPNGGRLLAAALKDGHIERDTHRFYYWNYDPENRRIIAEAVQRIFGDVDPYVIHDRKGKEYGIRLDSSVIGDMLVRAGAVEGSKVEQEHHLPDMITFGDHRIAKAYYEQSIRDDGNIDNHGYQIRIIGTHEIRTKLTSEYLAMTDYIHWQDKTLPSGAKESFVTLTKEVKIDLPNEVKSIYDRFIENMKKEWVPVILKEEAQVLERTFGVKAEIIPMKIYKGEKKGFRGEWQILVLGKENFEKMKRQLDSVWREEGDVER